MGERQRTTGELLMALFDPNVFDPAVFDTDDAAPYDPPPAPDPTDPPASTADSNSLFDGTLKIMVGALDVTAAVLPSLTWSTTSPGGFGECQFQLPGDSPVWAYSPYHSEVVKGAAVTITHGASPVTLFEGEITNDVSHASIEGGFASYDVTAAGLWWKAGLRKDYCQVWCDDDSAQWFARESLPKQFEVDTEGKVKIGVSVETPVKANSHGYVYYWLDNGLGDPGATITAILGYLKNDIQTSAGTFVGKVQSSEDWVTWHDEVTWTDTYCAAAAPWYLAIDACDAKVIRFDLYSTVRWANLDEDVAIELTRFSVITSANSNAVAAVSTANPAEITTSDAHDLQTGDRAFIIGTDTSPSVNGWQTVTRTGILTFTVPVNVTAVTTGTGQVHGAKPIADALSEIAITTGLATSSYLAVIGNGNWGLNVRPHMSRADAIETLAATNPEPIDYGFWDSKMFYCQERPASPPANNDYIINTDAPGIDFNVFANTEDSPTVVCVLYLFRDVDGGTSPYLDGTLRAVYRDVNGAFTGDWADASVVLDVWDQWADLSLEEGQAQDIGDQILDWIAYNQYVGTITIANRTVPLRAGGQKTAAYIRAGDYIQDAMATMARSMITSAEVDVDSGTVTLGIGETRNEFVARISARRGPFPRGHNPFVDKGDPLTKLAGPFSPALYGRPVR
jgi:hypothetical protein